MKLLSVEFNGVLGLNGKLIFEKNMPVLIYGENIAGKSNIINMLRYCLLPSSRRGKKYSEEKMISKDEIILEENKEGSCIITFEHRRKIHKLEFNFFKRGGKVKETKRLLKYEGNKWITLAERSEIKKYFVNNGIYPEILDSLISASNVRNFSEAISRSVIKIPEMISKKMSAIHKNSEKYIHYLQKLNGLLIKESDKTEEDLKELERDFEKKFSKPLKIDTSEIFSKGIVKNLETLRKSVEKKLEEKPKRVEEIKYIISELQSGKIKYRDKLIEEAKSLLKYENEFLQLFKKLDELKQKIDRLTIWDLSFKHLPSPSTFHSIENFKIPKYRDFDFNLLTYKKEIREFFRLVIKTRGLFKTTKKLAKSLDVHLDAKEINNTIKSYELLIKNIKKPRQPTGERVLLREEKGKNIVSIPFDTAIKNPGFLQKKIEPYPQVHRPQKVEEKKFKKTILSYIRRFEKKIKTLRKIKKNLAEIRKNLKKAKVSLKFISSELGDAKNEKEKIKKRFQKFSDEFKLRYKNLCKEFGIEEKEILIDSIENVKSSYKLLRNALNHSTSIFVEELKLKLKQYPEILKKIKGKKDILQELLKSFEEEQKKIEKESQINKDLYNWINKNIQMISKLENRKKAIQNIEKATFVLIEILSQIYQLSNVKKLIEDISDRIEKNVKKVYSSIFSDNTFSFEHVKEGTFVSKVSGKEITHPSGSQKAVISLGIMVTLGELFNLPIILDEALDRIDVKRLPLFIKYVTGLCQSNRQICIVAYKTFNIEKNSEVIELLKKWKIYLVKRDDLVKSVSEIKAENLLTEY